MTIKYLKKSPKTSSTDDTKTRGIVENILKDIEEKKEEGCKELGKKFDNYDGEIIVSKAPLLIKSIFCPLYHRLVYVVI